MTDAILLILLVCILYFLLCLLIAFVRALLPGKITVFRPQEAGPPTCTVPSSFTVMVMPSCTKSRNSSPRQSMTGI